MTRIEEQWNLYVKTSNERHRRDDRYTIAHVQASEICDALGQQHLTVDRETSTRTCEWDRSSSRFASLNVSTATVPLDTIFPKETQHKTREMYICGAYGKRDHETYNLVLTDDRESQRMDVVLCFESDIGAAPRIIQRVKDAFRSIEKLLATEFKEERAKREAEEKRRDEEMGYVHPDSFGGSDFS